MARPIRAPTKQETARFDQENKFTNKDKALWALKAEENSISRLLDTSFKAVTWHMPGLITRDLPPGGLLDRVEKIVNASPIGDTTNPNLLRTPRVGAVVKQLARFVDSFDRSAHVSIIAADYKSYGLIPTLPGTKFSRNDPCRQRLLQVAVCLTLLDQIIASELFHQDPTASLAAVEAATKSYTTSLEDGSLIANTHEIYTQEKKHDANTIARICRDTMEWEAHIERLQKMRSSKDDHCKFASPDWADIANLLMTKAVRSEEKGEFGLIEGNCHRANWSLITLFGLLRVWTIFYFRHQDLTSFCRVTWMTTRHISPLSMRWAPHGLRSPKLRNGASRSSMTVLLVSLAAPLTQFITEGLRNHCTLPPSYRP